MRTDYFKDFYFSTYFNVLDFLRKKRFVLKTELLYLGKKKQQVKITTLESILVVLETQKLIKLIPLKLGKREYIQVEYIGEKKVKVK